MTTTTIRLPLALKSPIGRESDLAAVMGLLGGHARCARRLWTC